ncbi:MAG TPA: DUF6599 family protein [Bryobacteraceae bacterium]|nr:DUF6599 family protein [Bryobacteraceae bacterium]
MKFFVALMLPVLASPAILPDSIGPFHRSMLAAPKLADQAIWDEYGLKEAESSSYLNENSHFTVTAYRFVDTTGSLAAFQWLRPADATPLKVGDQAVEMPKGLILTYGNYLLSFEGYKPAVDELMPVFASWHSVDGTPLPTWIGFFPSQGLVPNSERYISGPASLAKFDPGISPSVVGFHLGTEGQFGIFHGSGGNMALAVFNYPTPQIAAQKLGDFQRLPGAVVKRTGPLIAVLLSPPDADAAERLLAQVRYDVQVTLNEPVSGATDNPGNMMMAIFTLAGILIVFCVMAGLFVGGFRAILFSRRKGTDAEPMILLHLDEQRSSPR